MRPRDVKGHVFSYIPESVPDGGQGGFTVAITMLVKHITDIDEPPVGLVECQQDICDQLLRDAGIEPHRLRRITIVDVLSYPITFLETEDKMHILADGNHRYVAATLHGMEHMPARIVPFEMWQPYVVTGLPPMTKGELRNTFSGIY